jgi:hypothetical protein
MDQRTVLDAVAKSAPADFDAIVRIVNRLGWNAEQDAVLRSSGSHRWSLCPGSVRLCVGIPDSGSAFAAEGTLAHELAQICLERRLDADDLPAPDGYADASDGADWGVYPADMRRHVQTYLDWVRGYDGDPRIEQRVDMSNVVPGGCGTLDFSALGGDVNVIADLKYGVGVQVYAEHNPALMLYALGCMQTYGWLYDFDRDWELCIVQPRLGHIDTWRVSAADLIAWGEEVIKPAAVAALNPDAALTPGEEQCRFCTAKAVCRARAEANLAVAREEFGVLPDPDTLTPEEIGSLLHQLDELRRWVEDVKSYALTQAAQGDPAPGWKLVAGRSLRRWADEAAAARKLRALKYKKADYIQESLISVAAAEKLLGGRKAAAPVLEGLTLKPDGKPVLAPEADKRPALHSAASAGAEFTAAN